jgi:hypothetical protein
MSSPRKSIVIGLVVAAAAVALFTLFATQGSRALAQGDAAKAREAEALAREAKAKAQNAEAAAAKARAAAVQAAKEAQAKAEALAAEARAALAAKAVEATPLDLSKYLRMKAENFAKIKQYPWPAVPTGSQTFAGVPVNIQGAMMTFGQRNADNGLKYPETITGIACGQKFETLYILHGAFYEAAAGEPAYDVVLNYPGGEKQTDTILCGEDIRDWYINDPSEKQRGPTAKRSTLAWTGAGKSGMRDQEIRFCLTAIDNKYPDHVVETIDLVSPKGPTAGCILAITVGKKGLLKPEKSADKRAEETAETTADKPAVPKQPKVSPPKVKLPASP